MKALPDWLEQAGVDSRGLLAEFGLSLRDFGNVDRLVPLANVGRLLSRCAERTRCPHFGMLAGQRSELATLGALGYLVKSAPDVRTGLRKLSEYQRFTDAAGVVTLSEERPFASLSYSILGEHVDGLEQILDAGMAIGFNILRELCGLEWQLSGLQLAHSRRSPIEPFRRYFGVAPAFDAERSALIFAEEWLDRPLPGADPLLHELMEERVRELSGGDSVNLTDQLRRILRPLVTSQDCSLDLVAERLVMHRRTINRRLAAKGTSFRQIREDVRLEAACQLLKDTRLPAYEIAATLGYSDATAFSRAFRRWSGISPAAWRESGMPAPRNASRRQRAT